MKTNALSRIVTSFSVYKFLEGLTTPFIRTAAYQRGIIDENGNQIKPEEQFTVADKQAFTEFDRLVISLRRIILKVPDPYVRKNMTSVITALNLISEECESMGGDKQIFTETVVREMLACRLVEEGEGSAIANAMGGSFSTSDTNPRENPQGNIAGYDPPIATGKSIFRRKKPNKYYSDKNNSY